MSVGIDGRAEMASAHAVSGNFFAVLGVPPAAGRPIAEADDRHDAAPVAMISDGFWTKRFGRSADAIGRTIAVNGIPCTIAGIAPRGFLGTGR